MMRWRNNGLPITLFKANPALLLTTGKSDADGSTYLPLLGDDVNDKLRYLNANSNGTAEHQSGTILASLEKVAQSYGPCALFPTSLFLFHSTHHTDYLSFSLSILFL